MNNLQINTLDAKVLIYADDISVQIESKDVNILSKKFKEIRKANYKTPI